MKWTMILAVLTGLTAGEVYAQASYEMSLAGYNKIPAVRTPATGTLEITFHQDTLYVSGDFSDLSGHYWSAYIHFGSESENGNRLMRLSADLNEEKNGGEFRKEENAFHLRPSLREALRNGNLYINISSNRNQDGEIRGQVPRM